MLYCNWEASSPKLWTLGSSSFYLHRLIEDSWWKYSVLPNPIGQNVQKVKEYNCIDWWISRSIMFILVFGSIVLFSLCCCSILFPACFGNDITTTGMSHGDIQLIVSSRAILEHNNVRSIIISLLLYGPLGFLWRVIWRCVETVWPHAGDRIMSPYRPPPVLQVKVWYHHCQFLVRTHSNAWAEWHLTPQPPSSRQAEIAKFECKLLWDWYIVSHALHPFLVKAYHITWPFAACW